jgi:hypothetical protein
MIENLKAAQPLPEPDLLEEKKESVWANDYSIIRMRLQAIAKPLLIHSNINKQIFQQLKTALVKAVSLNPFIMVAVSTFWFVQCVSTTSSLVTWIYLWNCAEFELHLHSYIFYYVLEKNNTAFRKVWMNIMCSTLISNTKYNMHALVIMELFV